MLRADSEQIRSTIKSKDWDEIKQLIEENVNPRGLMRAIMSMAPELFEEKALFAKPENSYRCIEQSYFPAIGTDALIETIKQNRRKFI